LSGQSRRLAKRQHTDNEDTVTDIGGPAGVATDDAVVLLDE